jgi:hypothetical protein
LEIEEETQRMTPCRGEVVGRFGSPDPGAVGRGARWVLGAAFVATFLGVLFALAPPPARAVVPFKDIASPGPLTHVYVGNELSCQVAYSGDTQLELYPPSVIPGDCGTFVALGGTLYTPDFSNHGGTATGGLGTRTPFTPVSQTDVTGSGTSGSPFRVSTGVNAGSTGLQITEGDSYVNGEEAYRTDVTLRNGSGATISGVLYRAGDCYLQGSDVGFGFIDDAQKAAGCSANANNSPAGRIEQWFPITGGNQYLEGGFSSDVWARIGSQQPFTNTCRCAESLDNGAGLSWSFSLRPGEDATFSQYTVFSPRGVAGPPQPPGPPAGLPPIFGRGGLVSAPSNRRCVSRRNFRIRIRERGGFKIETAQVFLNRSRIKVVRRRIFARKRHTARVNLRGLPKGVFRIKIVVLTTVGDTKRGTRKYRTCTKRRRSGRPPRL